ncbi:MAG: aminopeptidase P family protein [Gammaproteobacteria bacterium]|nr:aminopeptidase P family protein [Gammaproteobacteria bacterium]
MTTGIGGSTAEQELASLEAPGGFTRITIEERQRRIARAQQLMIDQGIDVLYLDASSSLFYFTGLRLWASERLHGAVLPARGELIYITPGFEEEKTRAMLLFGDDVRTWEEHEDPTELVAACVRQFRQAQPVVAVDPATPFFVFDGLRRAMPQADFKNGACVTAACRMHKSKNEIALLQYAMNLTLRIQRSAARILDVGMSTRDVQDFLIQAHLKVGTDTPPPFRIVLFGEPTAYPHGVPYPQELKEGDMVLIDVGAPIDGYYSDITRSYVFGEPTRRQREVWALEKAAQSAAFDAAQLGQPAESVDAAARGVIEAAGFGPGYKVPGLAHRTGHGIGLDVHEETYIVPGNKTPLATGMCFSNEPMICIYGEFGVRLEDHVFMTETGPQWFTSPSPSIDQPFASSDI